ncbi:2'-5' RNA ligase family protein [Streptomyces sp. M19]
MASHARLYGDVEQSRLLELYACLIRAAHRNPPFSLRLAGGGRFSDRVLWAGVDGEVEALRRLADEARDGDVREEHRAYRPHLTVARVPGGEKCDLGPYAEALAAFEGRAWTPERLELVRSRLPDGGCRAHGTRPCGLAAGRVSGRASLEAWTRKPET